VRGSIADILFDLPLRRPLSYAVPSTLTLAPGQRVVAPLQGRPRVGLIVALRQGDAAGLALVQDAVEPAPVLSTAMLDLGRWAAAESLSSPGSTLAAFLPPAPRRGAAEVVAAPPEPAPTPPAAPLLWTGVDRHARLTEGVARAPGPVLVIAPDIESAARWAERLGAARLDSAAVETARRAAWFGAMRGRPRLVVGTRSALLLPLPAPVTLALLDEHDAAHKPPGAPRQHSRELLIERARREGSRLLLLSGAPAAETWHRAMSGAIVWRAAAEGEASEHGNDPRAERGRRATAEGEACGHGNDSRAERGRPVGEWPELVAADTRGILRNYPFTLPLTRVLEDASRGGGRVALVVSREAAALGCDECGEVLRCRDCGIALGLSRVSATLACRLCGQTSPLSGACPRCGGHRLSPFGWSPERVMTTLRKRFPRLTVARAGARGAADGARTARAQVLVGGAGLLRGLDPGGLAAVGFVALDGLLHVPDFRAGERAFQALWAAAEAVGATGRVIVQTLHPRHYAIEAARTRRRAAFYEPELRFRAELGYPPFRRLCLIDVRGRSAEDARVLLDECAATLRGISGLTVYPAAPRGAALGRRPWWRMLVKGPDDLPRLLDEPLRPLLERRRRSAGMVEIEMDPVSL
jgi:primosomal protein N' (replication factor Y) (superfamily II helicase)